MESVGHKVFFILLVLLSFCFNNFMVRTAINSICLLRSRWRHTRSLKMAKRSKFFLFIFFCFEEKSSHFCCWERNKRFSRLTKTEKRHSERYVRYRKSFSLQIDTHILASDQCSSNFVSQLCCICSRYFTTANYKLRHSLYFTGCKTLQVVCWWCCSWTHDKYFKVSITFFHVVLWFYWSTAKSLSGVFQSF